MARRIERSRIDAGKVELPRKLGFLTAQKVDYLAVTDRDGEFTVEVSAAALSKLVKAKGELKALKGVQKKADTDRTAALDAEKSAHAETRAALSKAERKLKALAKKLEESAASPSAGKVADAGSAPAKALKAAPGGAAQEPGEEPSASAAGEAKTTSTPDALRAPRRVSARKKVAEAAETVLTPPPQSPEGAAPLH